VLLPPPPQNSATLRLIINDEKAPPPKTNAPLLKNLQRMLDKSEGSNIHLRLNSIAPDERVSVVLIFDQPSWQDFAKALNCNHLTA
jgi:hypothetical protein